MHLFEGKTKQFLLILLGSATLSLAGAAHAAVAQDKNGKNLSVAVVNFKTCVENSKLGKEEQGNFEKMKKQMETILEEKEKVLNDLAEKSNDPMYLDSLSADAETDLKRKLRALSQEMAQLQNQYLQALNQANYKIVQKLTEIVSDAAKNVAREKKLDLVLNEEGTFYYADSLDISKDVIVQMNRSYDKQSLGANADDQTEAANAS